MQKVIQNKLNKFIKIDLCKYIKNILKYYKLVILSRSNFIKYYYIYIIEYLKLYYS